MAWAVSIMFSGQSQPAQSEAEAALATGFLRKTVELAGESYAYCVFVPPDYSPEREWPVILFLHGSGERGSDGYRQTQVGLGQALRWHHDRVPAIVVMPQCRADQKWTGPMAEMALKCVEETSRQYKLDHDRMYLTGLSLGGAGVWFIGSRLADQLAALVPICGFGDVTDAAKLAQVPTWCFHGAKDNAVPVERSREMVAAIRAAGGDIQYTEYPDGGHNVWDDAYGDKEMWNWLFAQRRTSVGEEADAAKKDVAGSESDPVKPEHP
jgi:predicted peptidase